MIKTKTNMKTHFRYLSMLFASIALSISACSDDDDPVAVKKYSQEDQMARPAINTVFVDAAEKDKFNTTTPSMQGAAFASKFNTKLLALNAGYTTNLFALNSTAFTGVLATDVLTVSLGGTTTFYDGTNVLTGRKLDDDVITVELILIFGGPNGSDNPTLTDDHVDANDHAFLTAFPYLAAAN